MAGDTTAPGGKTDDSELLISKISDGTNTYTIKDTEARSELGNKQDTLVSGTNIKTINSTSVLGSGNFTLADQSLSNLDSTGQMVIDTQNGTISNCILDIPQNLKLTLENNVLTLKAGSIITRTGSTYSTITTTQDITWSSSTQANKKMYLFASNSGNAGGLYNSVTLEKVGSGDTLPANGDTYSNFYLTSDKIIYNWNGSEWTASNLAYPLAIIETDENTAIKGFAKDSNGNDMIFNGTCFVGHHAVVYPNVKMLIPNGFNEDGSLKSKNITINSVRIIDLTSSFMGATYANILYVTLTSYSGQIGTLPIGNDVETKEDILSQPIQGSTRFYVKNENIIRNYNGTTEVTKFVHFKLDSNNIVTDFTIRQPVRTATVEMLDTLQNQVNTNTSDIANKQDTLVSGTNVKTINSISVLGSGNFALADQSLSNLDSTGQMIVDSQNGTISNCILDIPQNLKLFFDENNILQETIGSINVIPNGDTYTTITSTQTAGYMDDHNGKISSFNKYLCFMYRTGSGSIVYPIECTFSGATQPTVTAQHCIWYNTSDKYLYNTKDTGATWEKLTTWSFPVCLLEKDSNNKYQFAKDSNGNDMIFNGCGFIGQHRFVYPNVKCLFAAGKDSNGKLLSNVVITNGLLISGNTTTERTVFYLYSPTLANAIRPDAYYYSEAENLWRRKDNNNVLNVCVLANTSGNVDSMTIRQPVRTATVEMLDKKADQSLSNLDSTGQMVIDSQNGTISNCILEIPQNIKVELSNGILTVKQGSVLVMSGSSTYTTITVNADKTKDFSSYQDGKIVVFANNIGSLGMDGLLSRVGSGSSLPADNTTYSWFYLTTDYSIYHYESSGWVKKDASYPLCLLEKDSSGVRFAKDSNGNDMIFNGAGFIGHHVFVYPNVKGLTPNGLNADGSLKSDVPTTSSLQILELGTSAPNRVITIISDGSIRQFSVGYYEYDILPAVAPYNNGFYYERSTNMSYQYYNNEYHQVKGTKLFNISSVSSGGVISITDFTIRQPVRMATVEMLDTLQDQVDTNTTAISGKQDIIPSSVYIPQPYITDNTDDNAELDYLLASDGSSAGLSGITTYCSDYIEITGDYIILHDVYAPSDTTYASYVLYNSNKTFLRAYTSDSYPNTTTIGDVILNKEINGAKYVRFQTNLTTKPTFSIVTQVTSQQFVYNIIDNYPYTNMLSYDGSFRYITDINVETGLIGYPNGDNQPPISSIPRNRSSYIEIPQNGILLTDVFVPSGTTYSAFALYDSNKNIVNAYNRAKLGYSSGSGTISKLFIPYSSSYKYIRFQHIDTTSDIIYGIPDNLWYSMPKSEGNNGNLLEYNKNGETLWTPAGLVGDKKSLSIGVFGGSFATNYYAQTAYNKWIEKLGIDYTTYAVSGTGFVQGTNNFVVQATNAGIHDIYVIWCSTNDFTHSQSIGTSSDVYGTNNTIWANFKEVVRILYSKNPNAKVVLFTSSPHLSSSQGNEEGRGDVTTYTNTLKEHVEAQKAMCAYYSLPCLDQYNNSQQNGFNYNLVTGGSGFHLTPYGYSLLVNNQIDFLSKI